MFTGNKNFTIITQIFCFHEVETLLFLSYFGLCHALARLTRLFMLSTGPLPPTALT